MEIMETNIFVAKISVEMWSVIREQYELCNLKLKDSKAI